MIDPVRSCGVPHPGICGLDKGLTDCLRGRLARTSEKHRRAWRLDDAPPAVAAPPGKPRVSIAELARRKRH